MPFPTGPNRILYADDCLNVLRESIEPGSVDLIYLDPPFNSNQTYSLPFKGKYKSVKPVAAFHDTWSWGDYEENRLTKLQSRLLTKHIGDLVSITRSIEGHRDTKSKAAYLVNMYDRILEMRRVLKPNGSIYLHCDPTASHYLKVLMDCIFGTKGFRNEVIWSYRRWPSKQRDFQRMHDVILRYTKGPGWTWNQDYEPVSESTLKRFKGQGVIQDPKRTRKLVSKKKTKGLAQRDVFEIGIIAGFAKERLRYPTQKPLKLMDRIIKASSNPGDLVLDPFCGCGTTVHAAEQLDRRWIGADISAFSTELVRNRLLAWLEVSGIKMRGVPVTVGEARRLAKNDGFEFEKWACGHVGAEGMFHQPGARGSDRGVDGVLKFLPVYFGKKPKPRHAIVQVKGGHVTPDAVRGLYGTVEQFDAAAGVMICFKDQQRTVENNRIKKTFKDATGTYPVIQGLFVEDMLDGERPKLPNLMGVRP